MTISLGGSYTLNPKTGDFDLVERTLEASEAPAPAPEPAAVVEAEPEATPTPTPAPKRTGKLTTTPEE